MILSLLRCLVRGGTCSAALLAGAMAYGQSTDPSMPPPALAAPETPGGVLLPPAPTAPPPAAPKAGSNEELLQRIERLEQQNRELMKLLGTPSATAIGGDRGGSGGEGGSVSRDDVQKIVGDYLKTRDAEKSKADAAKKAEQERTGYTVGDSLGLTAKWNHGLWLESADKSFKVHVGGRTQFDVVGVQAPNNVMFGPGGIGAYDDAVNFRRARLAVEGTFWEVFNFNCEYDFLNTTNADPTQGANRGNVINTPVPTDLWITITHLPIVGNFRIGNHKPWIGFEHHTSSRFLNFLERSYQFDAFIEEGNNGFSPGLSFFDTIGEDDCGTWAVGAFKTTRGIFGWNAGDGEWGVSSRLTYLPVWKDNGRTMLHLGIGGAFKDLDEDQARYRARTMTRNGPAVLHNIATIAQVQGDNALLVNPELVFNVGPFTFQSEYIAGWTSGVNRIVRTPTQNNVAIAPRTFFNQGFYAEAWYFLTGEHREYNKKSGAFYRVNPYRNFYFVRGEDGGSLFSSGAWQVGARYSYLDNTNNGILGGTINSFTGGLNWFLNPNFKIQWNYEYGYRQIPGVASSGHYQGAGVRFAFDF